MKPLVSIIIPVYNASTYILETLDSIQQSTYRPLEIIMVDDASTDNSLDIVTTYAGTHNNCTVFAQENLGVSATRNHAIREAKGKYILPVDADDKIGQTYIEHAVEILENNPNISVVGCRARMFGDVNKEWKLPPFSHALLARKNMIPITSMFRRSDWEKTTGFCEQDIYREDWDFWISIMELGGTFYKLNEIGLFYRIRKGSRRYSAKQQKHIIIDAINQRHTEYLRRYLNGPLHYHRSWSRLINCFRSERIVGCYDHWTDGEIIFQQRNTLRLYQDNVCKEFATPNIIRGIIYGLFTPSKAKRSFIYASHMTGLTPAPIAYREIRYAGILRQSWYVCRKSACTHTFNELINQPDFPNRTTILQAIGRFTASLHQQNILHQDYSGGNILFNEDGSHIEIIDLNRVRLAHVSTDKGLQNFCRLNIDRDALTVMGTAYAQAMHIETEYAVNYIIQHRWYKHVRKGITNL